MVGPSTVNGDQEQSAVTATSLRRRLVPRSRGDVSLPRNPRLTPAVLSDGS